jgi:hypothetical protein
MPYNAEPGEVAYVTAPRAWVHGQLGAVAAGGGTGGVAGVVVKQAIPAADAARANRANVAIGEACTLLTARVAEAPAASLPGVTKFQQVWIATADDSLSTTSGAGKILLGKVVSLPGERGTPSDKVRINLRDKVV